MLKMLEARILAVRMGLSRQKEKISMNPVVWNWAHRYELMVFDRCCSLAVGGWA